MRRWLKKWWWVALILATGIGYVGWRESRCQAQAYQCRAYYMAQEARRPGFGASGDATEQQAINAACEPNGYFCRLFSSANLPTWLLVFVGMFTFFAIWRQARDTADAAKATEKSVLLQEAAFRQWLILDNWRTRDRIPAREGRPSELYVEFDIVNRTDYPLTFQYSTIWVGTIEERSFGRHLIPPNERYTIGLGTTMSDGDNEAYDKSEFTFGVRGLIEFIDTLAVERTQYFGGLVSCGKDGSCVFHAHSAYEQSAAEKDEQGKQERN